MRREDSHKGENGIVLVIGGSEEFSGAPYLATKAIACLRTGPDLVILACPEKVAWAVNSLSPDIITVKLRGTHITIEHKEELLRLAEKADVVLIGPGLGLDNSTKEVVRELVKEIKKPKVIDADAIKAIPLWEVENTIFTPHEEEFRILLSNSGLNQDNYREKLKENIILLKGHKDKVISKNRIKINSTGNAGMTVGGTGDVMSGILAGLLSQGMKPFDAAYKAANINGKIGDKLQKELGNGLIASDFLRKIAKMTK